VIEELSNEAAPALIRVLDAVLDALREKVLERRY
jgi:hypothetical protein